MIKNYDACIVGCGIIGSTIAISLARRGMSVLVIESGAMPLRGSTLAGFGALTPYSDPFFSGETAVFAEESLKLYREDWLPFIKETTGQDVTISSTGLLQIIKNKNKMDSEVSRYESNCIPNYRPKILNSASVRKLEPAITQDLYGALFHPEPWIDLKHYIASLEVAISSLGSVQILTNSNIQYLSISSQGEIFGVTNNHFEFRSKSIVISTGLDRFQKSPIRAFPIRWIRGDGIALRTADDLPLFRHNIYSSPGFIAPRSTGEMLLGSTYVDEGVKDPSSRPPEREVISFSSMSEIISGCYPISNYLGDATVERVWRGWRPASTDDYPILGPDMTYGTVIYAQAFLGLGITLSVAVGQAVAEYIADGTNKFPAQMSVRRFS